MEPPTSSPALDGATASLRSPGQHGADQRTNLMRVVICGAGVIGACAAYYLTLRGIEAVAVERTGVACAASGKAGGFLALDWCDGSPLEGLARTSFALHAELARELGADYGYR